MASLEELQQAHLRSVDTRLKVMARMISSRRGQQMWRDLASKILTQRNQFGSLVAPPKRPDAELRAIYAFVQGALRWTQDPAGFDAFYAPEVALRQGTGDCDDQTILVGVLAEAVGYPVTVRAVSFKNGRFSHVYPLVGVQKGGGLKWVAMDVTYGRGVGVEAPYQAAKDMPVV